MKQLFLLRHAKAVKSDGYADDRDRPLDPQGVADIAALKPQLRHLGGGGLRPDRILCSPAVRTRETLEHLAAGGTLPSDAETVFEPSVYMALASHLFALLHEQPDDLSTLLIVGHNPGLHQLVVSLADQGQEMDLHLLARTFPPLSLVALSFEAARWQDISLGSGTLDRFILPDRHQASSA